MFGVHVQIQNNMQAVAREAEKANFRNFGHAAAGIRKDAIASIEKAPLAPSQGGKRRKGRRRPTVPSQPGTPPHTRRNQIKRAILYSATKEGAVIGTAYSKFGLGGQPHEHGGGYKGQQYPERPFMFPALERQAPRLGALWRGSIGQ